MKLLLANPNTSAATTAMMVEVARRAAGGRAEVEGVTAAHGAPLILDETALATAAEAVVARLREVELAGFAGVIVAAFGDPGLAAARAWAPVPVTGLAEAGMAEAVAGGRAFAVVTTTPRLAGAIAAAAREYGHGAAFLGTVLTRGEPAALTADPARLEAALAEACAEAVGRGAEALVIGGGPLSAAAQALARDLALPVVEPVPAAIRLALRRAERA